MKRKECIEFINVKDNDDASIDLLREYYDGVYCKQFPDDDERDVWFDILQYLKNSRFNPVGECYFITLCTINDSVVAGGIYDYLPKCKWGVIEYIAVKKEFQGQGLGSNLLRKICEELALIAETSGETSIKCIAAEVNDPKTTDQSKDNGDMVKRLNFWKRAGFRWFQFPYCQPPLSGDRNAVSNLLLLGFITNNASREDINSQDLKDFIEEFVSADGWISEPCQNTHVARMYDWLGRHPRVNMIDIKSLT